MHTAKQTAKNIHKTMTFDVGLSSYNWVFSLKHPLRFHVQVIFLIGENKQKMLFWLNGDETKSLETKF